MKTIRWCRPCSAKIFWTRLKPTLNGSATWSVKTSGPAPVPPSPPSIVMKSTPRVPPAISVARSSQNVESPTADLMPTGRPVSLGDRLDEIEQLVGVPERAVRRPG